MLADIISYNSAISACERGRQWAMALWLLELLQEGKLQGDLITYNAAISALKNLEKSWCFSDAVVVW